MSQNLQPPMSGETPAPSAVTGTHAAMWWYLAFGLIAIVGYYLLPSQAVQNLWNAGYNLTVPLALLLGVRLHRPSHAIPWLLIAAGLLLSFVGDAIWTVYENFLSVETPFPSIADALYLGGYIVMMAGLMLMTRRRMQKDAAGSLLDALIITVGLGVVVWVFVMDPYAHDTTLPLLDRLVSLAYPLMDLLMLGLLARLWFAGGTRPRALFWLGSGFCFLLASDIAYTLALLAGTYATGQPVDVGWLLSSIFLGMAALDPSMRAICEPGPDGDTRLTLRRLFLLITAALLAPATLALQATRGAHIDIEVVVGASILLFLLIAVRMGGVLVELRRANTRLLEELAERERVEKAMRESDERVRIVFEHSPDAIVLIDPHDPSGTWTIVDCNAAACRMNGYTRDELVGQPTDILHVEPTPGSKMRSDYVMLQGERSVSLETMHRHKDGTVFPIEVSLALVTIGSRELVLGIDRDISERKRVEAELHTAHEAALEASRLKSEFLATMSHEIRTPMNGVIGMTELLLTTPLDADQQDFANTVRDSAYSLLAILNDILDFSKIEAGKLLLDMGDFDVRNLVETVVDAQQSKASDQRIIVLTDIEPEMPTLLYGDAARIRQVLVNLISNAVKFTRQGEVVVRATLDTHDGSQVLRCTVSDTGIGLSPETQARLFQPFTQADGSTTREYGGTGLGLAICKRLVELMGGTIGVESAQGVGSIFWFTVSVEVHGGSLPVPLSAASLQGLRVLVVEDNATHREIVQQYLAAWQMRSTSVPDAEAALAELRIARAQDPYAVVVTDLILPGMDGFALAQAVQAEPALSTTPLILLTGFDQHGKRAQALQAGFAGSLGKPAKMSQLLDTLTSTLANTASFSLPAEQVLSADPSVEQQHIDQQPLLLAEDNPVNQKLAVFQLRKLGYMVDVVSNGQEAVAAMSRTPYRLVLMDCQMSVMDGYEATAVMRAMEARTGRRRLPIIAMTANAMQGDREVCLAAGMDDYVAKPIKLDALGSVLDRWLSVSETNGGQREEGDGLAPAVDRV